MPYQLYNLAEDPWEKEDRYLSERAKVDELAADLLRMLSNEHSKLELKRYAPDYFF